MIVQKVIFIYFTKYFRSRSPSYLFKLIPENSNPYASRSVLNNQIPFFNLKTNFFKNFFFPAVKPNGLTLISVFAIHLREPNRIFSTQNFEGLKLITRMQLSLSQLAKHKFSHNFQDCINSICSCGQEIETTSHFFLHCFNYQLLLIVKQEKHFLKKLTSSILIFYSKTTYN